MFDFFKPKPPPIQQGAGMRANPLIVGGPATPQDTLDHAKYRLDAIHRTITQGANLTKEHLEEFRAETRQHVHTLVNVGELTDEQALAIIKANKGMPK